MKKVNAKHEFDPFLVEHELLKRRCERMKFENFQLRQMICVLKEIIRERNMEDHEKIEYINFINPYDKRPSAMG
jgi:hypothetical protein